MSYSWQYTFSCHVQNTLYCAFPVDLPLWYIDLATVGSRPWLCYTHDMVGVISVSRVLTLDIVGLTSLSCLTLDTV